MQWNSEAIVIKQQQFSDDKLLCWLFSATHGLYKGLLTLNKKTRNQIQVGSIVNATWRARLPEHLGTYYCELLKPLSMTIIDDRLKLSSVTSLCGILSDCLPEKILEARIYDNCISYLLTLRDHKDWIIEYLRLELIILEEMGYGLGLDSCAVSGLKKDLYYVSPKTGMAVTKEVGSSYHDKLLKLPEFLLKDCLASHQDILDAFNLLGHFIYKRLYKPRSLDISISRVRLLEIFSK